MKRKTKPPFAKLHFAQSIKYLAQTMPLDDISVQDIVDNCDLSRNSFYYHFHDKQELVCWIFQKEVMEPLEHAWPNDLYPEAFHWFTTLEKNKAFYVNAFTSNCQNNLYEYLLEVNRCDCATFLENYRKRFPDKHSKLFENPYSNTFITNMLAHMIAGVSIDWIKAGMKPPAKEVIVIGYLTLSDFLSSFLSSTYGNIIEPSIT
nr:TetR/AcrR family transcriptional regulator C-terminal domain-containing protein [uncultured Clostridium sp.]